VVAGGEKRLPRDESHSFLTGKYAVAALNLEKRGRKRNTLSKTRGKGIATAPTEGGVQEAAGGGGRVAI